MTRLVFKIGGQPRHQLIILLTGWIITTSITYLNAFVINYTLLDIRVAKWAYPMFKKPVWRKEEYGYQTSLVFKWSKQVWFGKGPVFEWHLNNRLKTSQNWTKMAAKMSSFWTSTWLLQFEYGTFMYVARLEYGYGTVMYV